jgi:hypothetical protein
LDIKFNKYIMKKQFNLSGLYVKIIFLTIFCFLNINKGFASDYVAVASGYYDNPSTWITINGSNPIPGQDDDIVIPSTIVVTVGLQPTTNTYFASCHKIDVYGSLIIDDTLKIKKDMNGIGYLYVQNGGILITSEEKGNIRPFNPLDFVTLRIEIGGTYNNYGVTLDRNNIYNLGIINFIGDVDTNLSKFYTTNLYNNTVGIINFNSGNSSLNFGSNTFENEGTIQVNSGATAKMYGFYHYYNLSTISILSGGNLTIQDVNILNGNYLNNGIFSVKGKNNQISTTGVINSTGHLIFPDTTTVEGTLINSGIFDILKTTDFSSGSTLTDNGGTINIVNSTSKLNINSSNASNFYSAQINLYGRLNGNVTLTYNNGVHFNNYNGICTGVQLFNFGSTLNINGIFFEYIFNKGICNWLSGDIVSYGTGSNHYFGNDNSGIFNILTTNNQICSASNFTNLGILNKNFNNTTSTFSTFINAGTVNNSSTVNNVNHLVLNGNTYLGGTINNNSIITIGNGTISGVINNIGTFNLNGTATLQSGAYLNGTGNMNINQNGKLIVPFDTTIAIKTITNSGEITGTGKITYKSGVKLNVNASSNKGILSGKEHIFESGDTINIDGANLGPGITTGTTIRNHGIFNWVSGDINTSTISSFTNETDGVVNILTTTNQSWYSTIFKNIGIVNKVSNNNTTSFLGGLFQLDIAGTYNNNFGILKLGASSTLDGNFINGNGAILYIDKDCTINGSLVNNAGTLILNMITIISSTGSILGQGGVLHINTNILLRINSDNTLKFNTITMDPGSNIEGIGKKTYENLLSGAVITNNNGIFSGNEHIFNNSVVINSYSGRFGSSTIIRNHGNFKWISGNINFINSPLSTFINETDGLFNILNSNNQSCFSVDFTNKGTLHITPSSINNTTFSSGGTSATFNNTGTINNNLNGNNLNHLLISVPSNLGGIINNYSILTLDSASTISGNLNTTGSTNINRTTTLQSGANLNGTGNLNINQFGKLIVPFDTTIAISTITNIGEITGAGKITYKTGVTLNNNTSTLSGNEHIFASGCIVNIIGPNFGGTATKIGGGTILRNFGTFNWTRYNINVNPTVLLSTFINETGGIINVSSNTDTWYGTSIINKGVINNNTSNQISLLSGTTAAIFTNTGTINNAATSLTGVLKIGIPAIFNGGQVNNFGNLTLDSNAIIGCNVICNGTNSILNLNRNASLQSGAYLNGTGTLSINQFGKLIVPFDTTIATSIVTNFGEITGTGKITYKSGVTLNTDLAYGSLLGILSGNEHIFANGSIVNIKGANIGTGTILRNFGTLNLLASIFNTQTLLSYFINETNGIVNLNTYSNSQNTWYGTNIINKGVLNRITGPDFSFFSNNTSASFTNTGTINNGTITNSAGLLFFKVPAAFSQSGQVNNFSTLTLDSNSTIGCNVMCNGVNSTLRLNRTTTLQTGAYMYGTGNLYINQFGKLNVPFDTTLELSPITNSGEITGTGKITYKSGVTLNNNDFSAKGYLTGNEHIFASGSIINLSGGQFGNGTILRNHGTFNWLQNDINPVNNPAVFINESDGTFVLNHTYNQNWYSTAFTNKGIFNKLSSPLLPISSFSSGVGASSFTNENIININTAHLNINEIATLGGTINNNGTLTLGNTTTLSGNIITNSTKILNINGNTTLSSTGLLSGTGGVMNLNKILSIPGDNTFSFATMNNTNPGNITGAGKKTYPNGIVLNMTSATLSGPEHIFLLGATVNQSESDFGIGTIIRNFGTYNFTGSTFNGSNNLATFNNETTGFINFNSAFNQSWNNTIITNKGIINKTTNTNTTFNGTSSASLNNSIGTIKGFGTIQINSPYTFTSTGNINPGASPGKLTFNNPTNFATSTYNCEINGTTSATQYDVLATTGQATLTNMKLVVDWGSFTPTVGNSFTIMTFTSRVGQFATVVIPPKQNLVFTVAYNATNVVINVGPCIPPTTVVSGGGTLCAGNPVPIVSIALTGISPWSVTYTNGTTPITVSGITSSPYNFIPTSPGTYTVSAVSGPFCDGGTSTGSAVVLGCSGVNVNVKVFTSNVDPVSGLMSTNLIAIDPMSAVPFPTTDPYFTGIYATSGNYAHVPNVTTPATSTTILSTNNIVDWIFVELRTGASGATSVAFAKAALLRNDGILLNSDGTPLSFSGASTTTPYFVAIKHRNHIGFMTAAAQTYPNSLLNLTNNPSTIYGSNALRLLSAGKYVMWAGDGNASGDVDPIDLAAMYPLNGNIIDEYNPWDMDLDTNVDNSDLLLVYPNNGNIIQQID